MPTSNPPTPSNPAPAPSSGGAPASYAASLEPHLLKDARAVKRRLTAEATEVVRMLESSLTALFALDTQKASEILSSDEGIDREEVAIEEACFRVMTLQAPVARDFRLLTFILKVNADVERVADHACTVSKVTLRLADNPPPQWPTSLTELGQRVPMVCHALLRAMNDEDSAAAKQIVIDDKIIDKLNRRLFDEVVDFMKTYPEHPATGLLLFRVGRELERVGDLMTNIAENIVYLDTGEIIRHAKRRLRAEQKGDA